MSWAYVETSSLEDDGSEFELIDLHCGCCYCIWDRAGERQIGLRGELHAAGWTRQHAYLLTSEQIARVQQHVEKQGILLMGMLSLESEDEDSGYVCPRCTDLGQVLNGWRPLTKELAYA